jgi:hypothetical protein
VMQCPRLGNGLIQIKTLFRMVPDGTSEIRTVGRADSEPLNLIACH